MRDSRSRMLGLRGSALAENLMAAGSAVRGFDVAPERMHQHSERGGIAAESAADAARGAWAVMTCLMTADIIRMRSRASMARSRRPRRVP